MGIGTLFGYLIGNRAAILALAAHPRAWVVGLMFVFSAGFAREYDGEDLLHEPWHLLLPLAASLVSSFFLYCVVYGISTFARQDGPSFFSGYRSFLGLFWLTAPLAGLYAIPYERFLDPLAATNANLATLAVVSAWRVALMVRVAVVLMGLPFWTAFFRILAYADGVALLALFVLPFPIVEIMGGVRLSEPEAAVRAAAANVGCCGGVLFPVWFVGALALDVQKEKSAWQIPVQTTDAARGISWPLWILAVLSLAVWIGILPFTQPEQQLRRQVELAFREGRIADGLAVMSAHDQEDFPPHWAPPPRYLKGEPMSQVLNVWDEFQHAEPVPWVREMYVQKLKLYVRMARYTDAEKIADLLNRMPNEKAAAMFRQLEFNQDDDRILRILDHLRPDLRNELIGPEKAGSK